MKTFLNAVIIAVMFAGCSRPNRVQFSYHNLSTNEIRVVNIFGFSLNVAPGYVMPAPNETSAIQASLEFNQILHVAHRIEIVWEEKGIIQKYEMNSEQANIPPKLQNSRIRFIYLGNGGWRVSRR